MCGESVTSAVSERQNSLVLGGEEEDAPVLPRLTPVRTIHFDHLLDPEAQTLSQRNKTKQNSTSDSNLNKTRLPSPPRR